LINDKHIKEMIDRGRLRSAKMLRFKYVSGFADALEFALEHDDDEIRDELDRIQAEAKSLASELLYLDPSENEHSGEDGE